MWSPVGETVHNFLGCQSHPETLKPPPQSVNPSNLLLGKLWKHHHLEKKVPDQASAGFRVEGLGVWGLGFRGLGFRV